MVWSQGNHGMALLRRWRRVYTGAMWIDMHVLQRMCVFGGLVCPQVSEYEGQGKEL